MTHQASYFSDQVQSTRRFFNPDPGSHTRPALIAGGCEWCAPDYQIDRRQFPYLAFEFVRAGIGRVRLHDQWYPLQAGSAYLFDSSVPHRIESDPSAPLVKFFFNLPETVGLPLLQSLGLEASQFWQVQDPARVAILLEESVDHALIDSPVSQTAAWHSLQHALAVATLLRSRADQPSDPAQTRYRQCRDHLLRHYSRLPHVEQAAHECGVTPSYLSRLFRRFGTETPHHLLTRLKMSHALVLLRDPTVPIKAVSHELGYTSPSHFSRAFKAWHGYPPSEAQRQPS